MIQYLLIIKTLGQDMFIRDFGPMGDEAEKYALLISHVRQDTAVSCWLHITEEGRLTRFVRIGAWYRGRSVLRQLQEIERATNAASESALSEGLDGHPFSDPEAGQELLRRITRVSRMSREEQDAPPGNGKPHRPHHRTP